MSKETFRFIVLTGSPGLQRCGKTTLVKKICHHLKEKKFNVRGFFTEEIRSGRDRIGFDVVLLSGERATLARISGGNSSRKPYVGKYAVDVKSFEMCIMPILSNIDSNSIIVLDEIGKMELLSNSFKQFVTSQISNGECVIFATIPILGIKPIPLVELIRNHPKTKLFTVNRENSNGLEETVLKFISDAMAE